MDPLHIKTPLIKSDPLSALCGMDVYLKLDLIQPSGSFKIRGLGYHIQQAKQRGCTSIVSSSGGNAGMAASYASKSLGLPVTIVMPSSTPQFMVEKLRISGAKIIIHGSVWDEAHAEALRIAASTPGSHVVHPFDHPEIFEGHKTIIQELEGQLNTEPSAIMCSVGGGGLVVGIFRGLEDSSWKNTSVLAVETEGAESFGQCFKQQSWVKINSIDTIAKTLGALQVAEEAYKLSLQNARVVTPITVTDAETVSAMGKFLNDHCFLVEPSCAANLATLYSDRVRQSVLEKLDKSKPLVIFVCGGSIVNTDLLSSLQATFLKNES